MSRMLLRTDMTKVCQEMWGGRVPGLAVICHTDMVTGAIAVQAWIDRELCRSWRIEQHELELFIRHQRGPRALNELEQWLESLEYAQEHPIGWDANGAPCEVMP